MFSLWALILFFFNKHIFTSVSWRLFEKWLWIKFNVTYFPAFTTWTHWNPLFKRRSTARQQVNLRLMLTDGQTPQQHQKGWMLRIFPPPPPDSHLRESELDGGGSKSSRPSARRCVGCRCRKFLFSACSHTRARRPARSQPAAGWALSRRRGSWPGFCSWAEQPESAVSLQSVVLLYVMLLAEDLFLKVLFHVRIKIKLHLSKNEKMCWYWRTRLDKRRKVNLKTKLFLLKKMHKVLT